MNAKLRHGDSAPSQHRGPRRNEADAGRRQARHNFTSPGGQQIAQTTGLARALSKAGFCSRREGWALVAAGRVQVNGVVQRDPERRVALGRDQMSVDGQAVHASPKIYVMLNKPRGLVTTAADEKGRATVFSCLADQGLPFLAPVGRLDKASEGLLLFTNDTQWAAHITDPLTHLDKVYHVQVDCLADGALVRRMAEGVTVDGELLAVKQVSVLRIGTRSSWIEVILDEGKNRQIRNILSALNINVQRLIRVAIGTLALGNLAKGKIRLLGSDEVQALR